MENPSPHDVQKKEWVPPERFVGLVELVQRSSLTKPTPEFAEQFPSLVQVQNRPKHHREKEISVYREDDSSRFVEISRNQLGVTIGNAVEWRKKSDLLGDRYREDVIIQTFEDIRRGNRDDMWHICLADALTWPGRPGSEVLARIQHEDLLYAQERSLYELLKTSDEFSQSIHLQAAIQILGGFLEKPDPKKVFLTAIDSSLTFLTDFLEKKARGRSSYLEEMFLVSMDGIHMSGLIPLLDQLAKRDDGFMDSFARRVNELINDPAQTHSSYCEAADAAQHHLFVLFALKNRLRRLVTGAPSLFHIIEAKRREKENSVTFPTIETIRDRIMGTLQEATLEHSREALRKASELIDSSLALEISEDEWNSLEQVADPDGTKLLSLALKIRQDKKQRLVQTDWEEDLIRVRSSAALLSSDFSEAERIARCMRILDGLRNSNGVSKVEIELLVHAVIGLVHTKGEKKETEFVLNPLSERLYTFDTTAEENPVLVTPSLRAHLEAMVGVLTTDSHPVPTMQWSPQEIVEWTRKRFTSMMEENPLIAQSFSTSMRSHTLHREKVLVRALIQRSFESMLATHIPTEEERKMILAQSKEDYNKREVTSPTLLESFPTEMWKNSLKECADNDFDVRDALQRALIHQVFAAVRRFPYDDNAVSYLAGNPTYAKKERNLTCFSGPWMAASLLQASGIPLHQMFYANSFHWDSQRNQYPTSSHGSLFIVTSLRKLFFLDTGMNMVQQFPVQNIAKGLNEMTELIQGAISRPVDVRLDPEVAHELSLPLQMHFIPVVDGIGSTHMRMTAHHLLAEGNFAAANAALDMSLAFNPLSQDAYYHKALLLGEEGKDDEAENCLRTALAIFPNHSPSLIELGKLLIRKDGNLARGFPLLRRVHLSKQKIWGGKHLMEELAQLYEMPTADIIAACSRKLQK